MRRGAGRTIECVDRDGPCCAVGCDGLYPRVQRRHRNRHVGSVCGDTILAHSDDGVHAVETAKGWATRTRDALVAGLRRVVEIGAPRALQKIAAGRGLVAKLRRYYRDRWRE